ncbi:MAG TPA: hypothetical protein IAD33_00950 [Candidatus Scatomorpha gallistercoris]|nr:hypothetical protein [Candidatus Scatomorpha gallistercoris]
MRRWQVIILALALVLVTAIGAFSDWWNGWRVSDELPPELDNGSIYAERLFTGETVSFSGGNFTPEAYTYLDNVGRGIKLVIEIFTNNSWYGDRPLSVPEPRISKVGIEAALDENMGLSYDFAHDLDERGRISVPVTEQDYVNGRDAVIKELWLSSSYDFEPGESAAVVGRAYINFTVNCGGYSRDYDIELPMVY